MASIALKSRLPAIAAELRPRVSAAVKTGAEAIAEEARARAPVGPPEVHLKDHFKVERKEAAGYTVLNDAKAESGPEIPYAHMVEFGTSKMAAQPFLIPAAEDLKDEVADGVTKVLQGL